MADTNIDTPTEAVSPSGINHLVLNVRDIDESHKFWTEIVGFKQVGELHQRAEPSDSTEDALLQCGE